MNQIDIEKYTEYRRSVENILTPAYTGCLGFEQQLAMFLTSYMVHSYLEGRSPTECAMKMKQKFPLSSGK